MISESDATMSPQEASPMKPAMSVLGIDIAKRVFHAVGMDERGKIVLRKRLSRHDLMPFLAKLPPVLIGIEACGGAHYWARRFREHGHEVKLMAPQFVKPYVKSNKNDSRDAEAIAEAVTRPTMRFVPIKDVDQLDTLAQSHPECQRLMTIPGIGPFTATALVAAVSDASAFKNGRQFAAWLGLVPRQYSTGGKERLLGISKRGDTYLRKLLVHGARATIRWVGRKTDRRSQWIRQLVERRGKNRTAVAVANKNARIVWVLLTSHQDYQPATS